MGDVERLMKIAQNGFPRHITQIGRANEFAADVYGTLGSMHAEIERLRAEVEALRGKALRFDIDRIGIEYREREAVELVDLRAKFDALTEYAEHHESCGANHVVPCTCGLSDLLAARSGGG